MLILGNKKRISLPNVSTTSVRSFVNRRPSYANVVYGNLRDAHSKLLTGWGCRSWDIYAAALGEEVQVDKSRHLWTKGGGS